MNKSILTILIMLLCSTICLSSFATDKQSAENRTETHRAKGYRGSVALTDQYIVWIGFDTSHGYMFNEHHYLGAGAGFFIAPTGFFPLFGHAFIDYNAYIFKRASTPTAGIKIGYMTFLGELDSGTSLYSWHAENTIELEPNIGWSWAFNDELGMRLSLGAAVFIMPQLEDENIMVMPKLAVAFEF